MRVRIAWFPLALLLASLSPESAARAGRVVFVVGTVSVERAGTALPLVRGQAVEPADIVRTGPASYAQLRMEDHAVIVLRPSTELRLEQYAATPPSPAQPTQGTTTPAMPVGAAQTGVVLSLLKGGFRTITGLIGQRDPDRYRVNTPAATIGIRGTHYTAVYCAGDCAGAEDGLHVAVSAGQVVLRNEAGELPLADGQYGFVRDLNASPRQRLRKPAIVTVDVPAPAEEDEPEEAAAEPEPPPEARRRDAGGDGDYQPPQPTSKTNPLRFGPVAFGLTPGGSAWTGSDIPTTEFTRTDAMGRLVAFESRSGGETVRFGIGTAQHREAGGHDPETLLRWGRWADGVAVVGMHGELQGLDLRAQSLHWIYAPDTALAAGLPRSGQVSYSLVGNTSPTDTDGNVGVLGTASLYADFTNQQIHNSLSLSVGGNVWNAEGSGQLNASTPLFHGGYHSVAVNQLEGGSGQFAGFFVGGGSVPNGAGLTYALEHGQMAVSGSAAFGQPQSATGQ